MYIIYCFIYASDKNPTVISAYKTKKGALNRYSKAIASGCYEKILICEK